MPLRKRNFTREAIEISNLRFEISSDLDTSHRSCIAHLEDPPNEIQTVRRLARLERRD
jgi:hypothetical protein